MRTNFNSGVVTETERGFETQLYVVSGAFSASIAFWFDHYYLHEFITNLIRIDSTLSGAAVIKDQFEREYVKIECMTRGHIVVSGFVI